jgi:hypothetical protein
MPQLSEIAIIVVALLGAVAIYLPFTSVRLEQLPLGSRTIVLSQPIDFGARAVAIPLVLGGIVCLAGALVLSGALDRWLVEEMPEVGIDGDAVGIVEPDLEERRVMLRLMQPDTMAGYEVARDVGDVRVDVDALVRFGGAPSVTCIALRDAAESDSEQVFRSPTDFSWPRSGYMYCVSTYGLWAVSRFDNGSMVLLSDFEEWGLFTAEEFNRLGVTMVGDTMTLRINDVKVGEITDATYAVGAVHLACGTPPDETPTAVCEFRDWEVVSQ